MAAGTERRRRRGSPVVALLLLAPFLGETLSTASSPLALPFAPLVIAMYGCGALLCREVAVRRGTGLPGLLVLGVAYAVYEEGLIDRFWSDPAYWDDVGVGDYATVAGTSVLLALHLTLFHVAISIGASVLLVEWWFPERRDRPWLGRRGIAGCAVVLGLVVPVWSARFAVPGAAAWVVASVAFLGAVGLACRMPARPDAPASSGPRRRGVAWTAAAVTGAHFVLTYAVPSLGIPWPLGVAIALAPVLVGVLVVRRLATGGPYDRDAVRVVCGVLSFFVVLDVAVGLTGRFDLGIGALVFGVLVWRWQRRWQREWQRGANLSVA